MDSQPHPGERPLSIVISYARTNSDFVDRLEADLRARDVSTWVDRRKLEAGQVWDAVIRRAIDNCTILLVIISPDALASRYVRREYRYAMRLRKEIIPVLYYPTRELPKELAQLEWVNLQIGLNYDAVYQSGLEVLIKAIAHHERIINERFRQSAPGVEARTGGAGAMFFALNALRSIRRVWSMSDREKFNGGLAPDMALIINAWIRRIFYLVLTLVCVVADSVLVSSRVPVLFGEATPPPFLQAIYSYLQILAGLMFVSLAAMSGMLIQEYTSGLPNMVRLEPDISETRRRFKLVLAVALLVGDVLVVMTLAVSGVILQLGAQDPLWVILAIFIGAAILVALSVFLAQTGYMEATLAISLLVVGGTAAMVLALISTIIRGLLVVLRGIIFVLNAAQTALRRLA